MVVGVEKDYLDYSELFKKEGKSGDKKMGDKKGSGFLLFFKNEIKAGMDWLKSQGISEGIKEFARQFLANEFKDTLIELIREEILELKKAIIKSVAFGIFLFSGIVICLVGFAQLLATMYPVLANGTNFLIIGLVLIVVAVIIYKTK